MKKIKVAQIGVANFGARRRELMRQSGLFELVAAYDLNPAALVQCEKEDGAKPVASYEELLAIRNGSGIVDVDRKSGNLYRINTGE